MSGLVARTDCAVELRSTGQPGAAVPTQLFRRTAAMSLACIRSNFASLPGQWADRTLGETAEAASENPSAETAIKIVKQAGRLGQKY
jgi:hypothetical protein